MPNRRKVFILDDEPAVLDLLEDFLGEMNLSTVPASTLSEARYKLNNEKFDLMILDYNIEKTTCNPLIKTIKSMKGLNKDSPILLITGEINKSQFLEIAPKLNGALMKPFDLKKFKEAVELCLKDA